MRRLEVTPFLTVRGHVFKLTQWEDGIILKDGLLYSKENTLKGESHERRDMKQDPKAYLGEKRNDGKQTVNAQLTCRGEANPW